MEWWSILVAIMLCALATKLSTLLAHIILRGREKKRNGGIAEWRNGGIAEWRNGGMDIILISNQLHIAMLPL